MILTIVQCSVVLLLDLYFHNKFSLCLVFAQLHSVNELGHHTEIPAEEGSGTPKNLTSDWLIVTALTSVIGHVFTASANSVSVGCIAVPWTREESTHVTKV